MALSDGIKNVVWMRRLLEDIGAEQHGPTVIYEDNQGAMAFTKNVGYQARTKHIDIRYHFIREKIAGGEVESIDEDATRVAHTEQGGSQARAIQLGGGVVVALRCLLD
ncbi:Polyprotein [Phytophthora palmivora]|uniref:Polyprotein n=1 Tax=Phytophthora palmivora TaxID=4796 RepID=A0A2P4YE66_9STRA|nr:Polyprotein [Phytophthora palmivora]